MTIVNTRCPITGANIDPGNLPVYLIVQYKGQGVGFSSSGSLAAWSKLKDAEKDAKLNASK